jgi:hypothetical protein
MRELPDSDSLLRFAAHHTTVRGWFRTALQTFEKNTAGGKAPPAATLHSTECRSHW